jgi:hypothetical protein
MREKMRQLKEGWTSPNAFPWDELTEIICGLDDQLAAMRERIDVLESAAVPAKEHATSKRTHSAKG